MKMHPREVIDDFCVCWSFCIGGQILMLSCLRPLPRPSSNSYFSSPASQGYNGENSRSSSALVSPTVNLSREYTLAVHTNSFGEIRTAFDRDSHENVEIQQLDFFEEPELLERVLQPSRESVQKTLTLIKSNSFTYLVSTYFEQSEHASQLCLLIYQSVHRARILYTSIHTLLDDLPLEFDSVPYSLSHSQCNFAFNTFLQFDLLENPFLSPNSHNFNDMRECFSQLRQKLDHHRRKSRSRVHLICPAILPSNMKKKETVRLAQIDAAARGAYVLRNDLDTIDRLVARLYTAVENDKLLVHMGSERGIERYTIQEILKQLRRNRSSFLQQLVDLEEHLFLCFAAINRARSLLLQEIHMHQDLG